jgi:hypothetical protein
VHDGFEVEGEENEVVEVSQHEDGDPQPLLQLLKTELTNNTNNKADKYLVVIVTY